MRIIQTPPPDIDATTLAAFRHHLVKRDLAPATVTAYLHDINPQKRHPKPMTPYKSILKWVCDRIGAQAHRMHGYFSPLQSMVCYDCHHLLAPLYHDPVSRAARHLEKPASPPPLLAGLHASPVSRAENLGRACPLDAGLDH